MTFVKGMRVIITKGDPPLANETWIARTMAGCTGVVIMSSEIRPNACWVVLDHSHRDAYHRTWGFSSGSEGERVIQLLPDEHTHFMLVPFHGLALLEADDNQALL